ncbi:MAG: HEAT repeat domain-containing protein [Planctomycetes bacterium]|nr:HEAT repeat domain-containing protein [Planctomycetota bacterium]
MSKRLVAIFVIGIFLSFGIISMDTYGWCPNPPKMGGYTPPPRPKPPDPAPEAPKEQPRPPEAPKEAPKTPESPKEQPKQSETPKESETPKQPEAPKDQPATPPVPATPEAPKDTTPPPPPPPTTDTPFDPNSSVGGTGGKRPTSGGASVTRPPLDFGLQPRIQAMTQGTSNLLGYVEPWEVWWTRNRAKYLKFRQPIEFISKTNDGYVNVAKEYDEIFNLFNKALHDKDLYVRVAAAQGLSKMGDNKVNPILKKAFYDEKQLYVENNIIFAMGLMGDATNAIVLKEIAVNKQETEINRAYAILALGYVKNNEEVIKVLKELAGQPDKDEVVASAALALGNLKEASAVPILAKLIQRGVLYQGEKSDRKVRTYAALGLGRIGTKEAVNELKKSLDDKDKDVQECVAIALGSTKLPEALNPLIQLLSDRDLSVRGFAAISLSQILDKAVYPLLSDAYRNAKDPQVDGMIVLAMGLNGDKRAIPELQKILTTKTKRSLIKGAAAIALGLLKDTSSVQIISDLLDKSNDPVLAAHLTLSLGMIGDIKAVDVIKKKWADVGSKTTNIAYTNMAVALTMLGARDELVLPMIRKHFDKKEMTALRQHAIHSAGLIGGKDIISDVAKLYDDETNPQVRNYIVSSLGFVVDVNETPLLTKVTADNDYNVFMWIMEHLLPLPLW